MSEVILTPIDVAFSVHQGVQNIAIPLRIEHFADPVETVQLVEYIKLYEVLICPWNR